MLLDTVLNTWVRDKQDATTLEAAQKQVEATHTAKDALPADKVGSAPLDTTHDAGVTGLDIAAGIAQYNNEAIYRRILSVYLKSTPSLLAKLQDPTQDTLDDYIVDVHGLKGSSYGVHAQTVGKMAEELEKAGKAGDFETILANNPALIEAANTLLQELELYLNGDQD
jgi:HPt (histidine-containing phosphotransfer) domain-containing protein